MSTSRDTTLNGSTEGLQQYKPLATLKNRIARLDISSKCLKEGKKTTLWTNETRLTYTRMMGREVWTKKGTAHDAKHAALSVKCGRGNVMAWAFMTAGDC